MIEKIIFKSRITEVHGTTRTLITAYEQTGLTDDSFLKGIYKPLGTNNNELSAAIERSQVESIMGEKDEVRDEAIRAVNYLSQGYQYHPNQEVRNAADIVKKIFNKYGLAIIKESYVTESSHIVSMLGDFAAPDVAEAIAMLNGLAENIAALKAAQADFETTRAKYASVDAKESTYTSATVLKKEVLTIINEDLVQFLRAAERFKPEVYGEFARTVAEIINKHNQQVKKRR